MSQPDVPFDAVLLVSFGGPEGNDDVIPFLENVTQGRGIPAERLAEVGEHYFHFGGVSPINQQNRELAAAVRLEFADRGQRLPLYWGNRNWMPFLPDTISEMRDDGCRRAIAFFTSAYSSYPGCRQYRENIAAALGGYTDLQIERVGPYFNHAGFVDPFVDSTMAAIERLPPMERDSAHLVFTTHSIPQAMAASSGASGNAYVTEHEDVAALVAESVSRATGTSREYSLAYQSRSGPPSVPWLEPDIADHLEHLHASGVVATVVVPIGFVSDHMEVIWDLDTQAQQRAQSLGMTMERAGTPGGDPRFVAMIADLVIERLHGVPRAKRQRLGRHPAAPDRCATGCCPNPRRPLAAIGGLGE